MFVKGCLLIHGFTGTPGTVSVLKDALLAADFRVSTPCLAGHGAEVSDLEKSTWKDWYETVRAAFVALRRDVDKVYCAGISLGALLSLKLALDEGWGVRALALISTPFKLGLLPRLGICLTRYTPARWVVRRAPKDWEKSIADPEARALYEKLSLPFIPARAAFEVSDFQKELIKDLHRISNPMLLLHARKDRIAPISNVDFVKQHVASDIVETAIFKNSLHVLTMDFEKHLVANTVVDFFKRFA